MQLFGTKGQQDNGTSSKSCYGIGRDGTRRDNCCFRTYFSCFRASFPVYNVLFPFRTSFCCLRMSFSCFLVFMGKVIGTSQDRGVCPWIFAPDLVPGQRSKKFQMKHIFSFCKDRTLTNSERFCCMHALYQELDECKGVIVQGSRSS